MIIFSPNKSNCTHKLIIGIIFILAFFSIYILNKITFLYGDDWIYSAIFGAKEYSLVKNIFDIINSQYNHYFIWGGRCIVHFIDQLILLCNHNWISIIKSLCFILFIYLIYRYSFDENKNVNISLLIFEIVLIYSCYIHFEEVMLWTTGAANYLFGTTIVVLFLYPFYTFYIKGENRRYNTVLFFLFGIISGWTNENTGASLIFILLTLFCYLYNTKISIPRWFVGGLVGVCIGYLLMVLAPGNYERFAFEVDLANQNNLTKFEKLSFGFNNVLVYYTKYYQVIILFSLYLIGLIYMYFCKNINSYAIRKIKASFVFFIAGNISSLVMAVLPVFAARATFPLITFLLIAIVIIYSELIKYKCFKYFFYFSLLLISLFAIRKYYYIYDKTYALYKEIDRRNRYIESQKEINNLDVILPIKKLPVSVYYIDLSPDSTAFVNRNFCNYYGLKSIRTQLDEE